MSETSGWSRLRWPIKALIIALPIIGIGYLGSEKGWFKSLGGNSDTTVTNTTTTTGNETTGDNTSSENKTDTKGSTNSEESRSFAYQPEKPVDGELKGVVEVGATGFNSFVINMDKSKRWEIKSKDFGKSMVYEGMATTDDIRAGLKKYISDMFDKGVKSKNIHFVISSGAQKEPKTTIISSELKKMGFVVNLITAEQEGKLALKSAMPPSYNSSAFVTDIGSGNTKISWMNGGSVTAVEAPGAKYFEKDMKDDAVYAEVKNKASQIPKAQREVCFIIGGVPFELANQHRQGEERYTVLKSPAAYNADKPKTKSGLNIYKAIIDATGCDTFVFDWDANFSIGFLLSLP
ncbi:MAG: hypothetical protein V4722_22405 [Bacteroidota bacterium]